MIKGWSKVNRLLKNGQKNSKNKNLKDWTKWNKKMGGRSFFITSGAYWDTLLWGSSNDSIEQARLRDRSSSPQADVYALSLDIPMNITTLRHVSAICQVTSLIEVISHLAFLVSGPVVHRYNLNASHVFLYNLLQK